MAILKDKGNYTELHIGGEFVCSTKRIEVSMDDRNRICALIDTAVSFGEMKKRDEIAKVLRVK